MVFKEYTDKFIDTESKNFAFKDDIACLLPLKIDIKLIEIDTNLEILYNFLVWFRFYWLHLKHCFF